MREVRSPERKARRRSKVPGRWPVRVAVLTLSTACLDGLAGARRYSTANVAAIPQQLHFLLVAHLIYGVGGPLVSRD
jgi:hypothetical protein